MIAKRSAELHEITAIVPVNDERFGMFTAEFDQPFFRGRVCTPETILLAAGKCVLGRPLSAQYFLHGDERSATYLTKPVSLDLANFADVLTPLPNEITTSHLLMIGEIMRQAGRIGVDPFTVDWKV